MIRRIAFRLTSVAAAAVLAQAAEPASRLAAPAIAAEFTAVGPARIQKWILPAIALALFGAVTAPGAKLATKRVLTLDAAKAIAAAAEKFAVEKSWKVNIAIMDDGANLLYFQRMLGVQIGSIDVAIKKAESAIKFMRPTKAFSDAISTRPGMVMLPGALAVEGGLPITWEGEVLGAIGVSGLTSEEDGVVAKAGVDSLKVILSPPRSNEMQDSQRQP